jgi:NAD(P)-dependent dehydrogenase (short-subunit alcohol dehydrogenase family)
MLSDAENHRIEHKPGAPRPKESLKGRVALVTGAAGGLGSALAQALARRGATVLAADVDIAALHSMHNGAEASIEPLYLNLTEPRDIVRCVETITRERGRVDILAHTAIRHFAGDDGHELRPFTDHSVEQVLETLAVSVTGPTLLTQLVCRGMLERRSGSIVFTGSMHRTGTAGIAMYTAAKAYVNTLARALFLELREHNITTLVANPGGMHTNLHGYRYPWMLDPVVVAEAIANQLMLPEGVAVLSFEIVPHDPENPDGF